MNAIRFRVFRFVIGRFGRFRKLWILTQAFDLGLGLLTLVTSPSVFVAIVDTRKQIAEWPGIRTARHRLGGSQFNLNGIELGHIHSNGVADIALTSTEQANVLHEQRSQRHHTTPKSTWVSYFIERITLLSGLPLRRNRALRSTVPAKEPLKKNGLIPTTGSESFVLGITNRQK